MKKIIHSQFLTLSAFATALTYGPTLEAMTLWSVNNSYLGTGYFYGPGTYPIPTPLFPAMIRNIGFTSDRDFVTPFWNNGAAVPNVAAEQDFPPVDGQLSDGSLINENVDLGSFTLGGVKFLPAVVEGGEFSGEQVVVTMNDGNLVMVMDLVLDLGIGAKGIIRFPFYGTTGTITIPHGTTTDKGAFGLDQAGPLRSGATIAGRIGDFNHDGFVDGTLVGTGMMPASSPVYPGQPYVLSRNFETDVPIDGALFGSAVMTDYAYKKDLAHVIPNPRN